MARVTYDVASDIILAVGVELGIFPATSGPAGDVFTNSDPNVSQLAHLLNRVGRRLIREHEWLQATKEHSFTTTADSTYPLPQDYWTMIDQTGWNRSNRLPLHPSSAQEWQYLKATESGATLNVVFRPRDNSIEVWPQPPPAGELIAFEYRSIYWSAVSEEATETDQDFCSANSNMVFIDSNLVCAALKLSFKQAKGFDTQTEVQEYSAALEAARDANVGAAPRLSLNGGPIRERLLDERNAPGTGLGFDSGGLF